IGSSPSSPWNFGAWSIWMVASRRRLKLTTSRTILATEPLRKTVSVIGLGPVGLTWSSYLIKQGWQVLAFETNTDRAENLSKGLLPFKEDGLEEILFSRSRPHPAFQINPKTAEVDTWFVCTGFMSSEDMENVFSALDFAA